MRRALLLISVLMLSLGLGACASQQTAKTGMPESEYQQIMALQKHRQQALVEAEQATSPATPEPSAEERELRGDNALRNGNEALAFMNYQKAILRDPGRSTARYKLGLLYLKKSQTAEAAREFEEILRRDPQNTLAHDGLGRVCLARQEWDKAREHFSRALALNPGLWQTQAFIGESYDREHKYNDAVDAYQKAIALNGSSAMLYNNLGLSYLLKGEDRSAAEAFVKALKCEPENRKVCNNLGLALCRLGKYDAALEAFSKASDKAGAYNNLGCFYLQTRHYAEAVAAFEHSIAAKPSYYEKAQENLKQAQTALAEERQRSKLE